MTVATQEPSAERRLIAILIVVSAVNPLAVHIIVPSMPSIMTGLSADFATVQLVLSAYLIATAVAQLFLGPLSDRFGRRPVLIIGLSVSVAASIASAFAPSIEALIVGRVIQGAGGCAGFTLSRAIVRDRYDREESASILGYVTMGFATAPMVAPLIGGLIDDYLGWRSIFVFLAMVGAAATVAAWIVLPETRIDPALAARRQSLARSFVILSRIPAFWAFSLTSAFGTAVFFSFLGGTPFIASGLLGLSSTQFGLYFLFVPLNYIIGNYITARYSRRLGSAFMTLAGTSVMMAGVSAMAIAFALGWLTPISLFAPVYAIGLANGLLLPTTMAGSVSVRPDLAGAASGFAGAMQIGFGAVGTLVIGVILSATDSALPLALTMVLFAALSFGCGLWSRTARS